MSDNFPDPPARDSHRQRKRSADEPKEVPVADEAALNIAAPTPPNPGRGRFARIIEGIESLLSVASFLGMFLVVLIGVFFRYVLNAPLTWSVAAASSLFIWTTMITAGLPHWNDEHIQFDIVYLRFSLAGQRWARIVGNLIIILPALIVIPASFRYLQFIHPQQLSGLNVSQTWAFAGIAWFYITTVLHRGRILVHDLMSLRTALHTRSQVSA